MLRNMTTIVAAFLIAAAPSARAQSSRPQFEVVSVKRNSVNGQSDFLPRRSGDLIMMHNTQPYTIIFYAYHLVGPWEIDGYKPLPEGWNWFDIDARVPTGATDDQVRVMFQSLLAERFKLVAHRESKLVTRFELVIKGKAKLQSSFDGPMEVKIEGRTVTTPSGTCGISIWKEGSHLVCNAATVEKIAASISGQLHGPVVDRTGLTGTYNLNVRFIPDERALNGDVEPGPSLAKAIEEELGLKLESARGPVEVLVIDAVQKPSEN